MSNFEKNRGTLSEKWVAISKTTGERNPRERRLAKAFLASMERDRYLKRLVKKRGKDRREIALEFFKGFQFDKPF